MSFLVLTQPSESYAESISRALWGISRPASVRDAKDVTELYTSWVVHPDGRVALYVPDESKNVHELADVSTLVDLISLAVTDAEADAIETVITESKGDRLNILDVIKQSPSLSANLKTREQLESAGWFPTPEI